MLEDKVEKWKWTAVPAGCLWIVVAAWLVFAPAGTESALLRQEIAACTGPAAVRYVCAAGIVVADPERGIAAWTLVLAAIFVPPFAIPALVNRVARRYDRRKIDAWQKRRADHVAGRGGGALLPADCKKARDDLGWSQEDLAWRAGVSVMTLAQFEQGRPQFSWIAPDVRAALEIGGADLSLLPPPPPMEADGGGSRVLEAEV